MMAHEISRLATCKRLRVGCIITDERGFILSTGYNGAPAGTPHCRQDGCIGDPKTGQCIRAIHAELNAVITAANQGVSLKESIAYVTTRPCTRCLQALIQVGVTKIYYDQEYASENTDLFNYFVKTSGIDVEQLYEGNSA